MNELEIINNNEELETVTDDEVTLAVIEDEKKGGLLKGALIGAGAGIAAGGAAGTFLGIKIGKKKAAKSAAKALGLNYDKKLTIEDMLSVAIDSRVDNRLTELGIIKEEDPEEEVYIDDDGNVVNPENPEEK